MSVRVKQNKDTLIVGDLWVIAASVRDLDGCYYDATPVVTITLPNGTTATPTVERRDTGIYRTSYTVASAGRYLGSVAASGYGTADLAVWVNAVVLGGGMPTAADVVTYLNLTGTSSYDDADVAGPLAAEAAAQRDVCRIPAVYPASLAEALKRRVARNLEMRKQPRVGLPTDGTFTPTADPEVRRLERPYRKVRLG